ncbi:hypothetical protein ACFWP5_27285 [Streptomyces sp. NPDC058469]|uniref:hypothetical protein n=1 Tax=Streptomyces sp. NPDC058469 TaxID=3346514 RepID=UPI0036631EC7
MGEAVIAVAVTENGLSGDRVYAVLDGTSAVGSAKHPRKWGELPRCRSRLDDSGVVRVVLPDGTALLTTGDVAPAGGGGAVPRARAHTSLRDPRPRP